jgi:hypothetical protein
MPGAVVAGGMAACAAAFTVGLVTAGSAAVFGQRLADAADAAALAAADGASGAAVGVPCELAGRVAAASGVAVERCEIDGLTAVVTVSARLGAFTGTASSRAGQAG